jgi:hypothetical protein
MERDVQVLLTADELGALCNALNELRAIEDWEFDSRVGLPKADALLLHDRLLRLYDQLRKP